MATLTIRDLDEEVKRQLRIRAASRNRSMEEEARQILAAALATPAPEARGLASRIRAAMQPIGGVDLPLPPRTPGRPPPDFSDPAFDPAPPKRALSTSRRSPRPAR